MLREKMHVVWLRWFPWEERPLDSGEALREGVRAPGGREGSKGCAPGPPTWRRRQDRGSLLPEALFRSAGLHTNAALRQLRPRRPPGPKEMVRKRWDGERGGEREGEEKERSRLAISGSTQGLWGRQIPNKTLGNKREKMSELHSLNLAWTNIPTWLQRHFSLKGREQLLQILFAVWFHRIFSLISFSPKASFGKISHCH